MARVSKRKAIGAMLCLVALGLVGGIGIWIHSNAPYTDNAYVRGDITSLAPKIAGYVVAVEVGDNQAVERGDLLFRIDDADYRAKMAQAEANVAAAHARLANIDAEISLQNSLVRLADAKRRASLAELSLATKVDDRRRLLVQSSVVSQSQVDESDAAKARADAGVSGASASLQAQQQKVEVLGTQRVAADAMIAQAKAARDLAQIDLESTTVIAPISGVVGNRQVRVGRLVAPGASLLDIVPVHNLWVVANFKETQVEHIRPGQRVHIMIDSFPNERFEGVVDSFAPGSGSAFSLLPSDNATGNFVRVVQRVPVKIQFTNRPSSVHLVPGLSARVEVVLGNGS